MINVTKTYLPNQEKYFNYVSEIYKNGWITNNGPMVKSLEDRLAKYLGVKNLVLVSNGTVALEIAYRVLDLKGSAITTPFSFVATTSSLINSQINPVFADIDPLSWNLNSDKVEQKLMESLSDISAILPVHVFGNPCQIDKLETLSRKYDLSLIFDAAHAFGVKYNGQSVLNYGDISTLSFHATKLFHTIEGGAIIINDDNLVDKARYLINFGIKDPEHIPYVGTNAKMNEFEAAMGHCVLDEIDCILTKRKELVDVYIQELSGLCQFQKYDSGVESNNSYFPILLESEKVLKRVQDSLLSHNINPRRYFYPSLDSLDFIDVQKPCQVSRDICSRILCLPLYPDLSNADQDRIITIIRGTL